MLNRRQLLLGSAGLLGAGLTAQWSSGVPGLVARARAADMPRPDHLIRASSNENPYGPSRRALQAIAAGLDDANKYGGITDEMIALMARLENLPEDHITVGSGSGELLSVGGLLGSIDGGSVVCPDPTFEGLTRYVGNMGSELIRVPVDDNLRTDLNAMYDAIRPDTSMVYVCNPNNPIPNTIGRDALRDFVLSVSRDRLVFVDEAYHEFVHDPDYESMLPLIREGHNNIIVSRTASKIHGLAGLRVGFGFAHPDLITELNHKMTGQLNILGMHAAHVSYQDQDFQDYTLEKNRESLAIMNGMCDEIGARYVPSQANFTFIETGHDIDEVRQRMREAGILIGRPFPPFRNWARISMQTPEEMRYVAQVYRSLYG
ncbi:MAG: pyridoxal phosphate-dependent aminotransferase [Pseudomonadota bacterium]